MGNMQPYNILSFIAYKHLWGGAMKIKMILSVELSEEELKNAESGLANFCRSHLKICGLEQAEYSILDISEIDEITLEDCDFPDILCKCLHKYNIFYITDIEKFRLSQINQILIKGVGASQCKAFLPIIEKALRKYGLAYNKEDDTFLKISECGFSKSAINGLTNVGIIYLQDISLYSRLFISRVRSIGSKSLEQIDEKLKEYSLWYDE